jgi:hypothetical protein
MLLHRNVDRQHPAGRGLAAAGVRAHARGQASARTQPNASLCALPLYHIFMLADGLRC